MLNEANFFIKEILIGINKGFGSLYASRCDTRREGRNIGLQERNR